MRRSEQRSQPGQGDVTTKDPSDEATREGERAGEGAAAGAREPYEPPRIRTGPAFERVMLASSVCNDANIFEGCTNPCG